MDVVHWALGVGLTVRRLGRAVLGRRLGRAVLRRRGAVLGLAVKLVGSRGGAEHPAAFEILHEELKVGEELCARNSWRAKGQEGFEGIGRRGSRRRLFR